MASHEFADVESRIRRAYNADGMIDTLLGLGLIGGGLNLLTHSIVAPFFVVVIVALSVSWRRKITYPRLGYASAFNARDRRRGVVMTVLLALLVLLLVAVGVGLQNDHGTSWLDAHARLVFGGFLCCVVAAAGVARRAPYLYVVAAGLFGLIAAADRLTLSAGYPIALVGCVMIAVGLIRLTRFLRANPVVADSADPV